MIAVRRNKRVFRDAQAYEAFAERGAYCMGYRGKFGSGRNEGNLPKYIFVIG